ncbi:MAG TPA: hypothetical protein VE967_04225 [Gemmatimonadaceae bacterium]|nr:hypothetical protein [Gemmatimonadaceae bacterium]
MRVALIAGLLGLIGSSAPVAAQDLIETKAGRFTAVSSAGDSALARHLIEAAAANDTFPGLPRPRAQVTLAIAESDAVFREWVGPEFPEWGVAAALPERQRLVMHGRRAGGEGNPLTVLRHELAHLALAEYLGELAPRWFDEGYASYAAAEWGRDEVLATSFALILRGPRTFAALDSEFTGGTTRATAAYAFAYRAVAELASLDRERGLAMLFRHWKERESLDAAIREAYGMTLLSFQERWASRTRRRYGGLALVADLALVGALMGLAVVPLYLSRRKRNRQRLETLRIGEELQAQRARESALDALLGETRSDSSEKRDGIA